jgi:hypothetical protein
MHAHECGRIRCGARRDERCDRNTCFDRISLTQRPARAISLQFIE